VETCPNQRVIWTALVPKREIVSESEVHLDSIGPKKENRVRIRGSFGQHLSQKGKSCPNQRVIRTASVQNREIVSESRVYSDSIDPKKGNRVRNRGSFGQHQSLIGKSCPNQGHIRTELVQNRGIVSNQGYIRTALIPKKETVSELEGHSDSIDPKKGNRVRIRGSFGQHRSKIGESCPNQGYIRTALIPKKEIMS
jgi:predicted transcriptional regulator